MARCQGIVIFRFVLGSNAAYRSLNGSVEVGRGLAAAKLHRVDADRSIDAEIGTATLGDVQENRRSLHVAFHRIGIESFLKLIEALKVQCEGDRSHLDINDRTMRWMVSSTCAISMWNSCAIRRTGRLNLQSH